MNDSENLAPAPKMKKRKWIIITLALLAVLVGVLFVFSAGPRPVLEVSYEGRTTSSSGELVWMFKTVNKSEQPLWVQHSIIADAMSDWGPDSHFYLQTFRKKIDAGGFRIDSVTPPTGNMVVDTYPWRYCAWYVDGRGKLVAGAKSLLRKLPFLSKPATVQDRFDPNADRGTPFDYPVFMGPVIDPANPPPENPSTEKPPL